MSWSKVHVVPRQMRLLACFGLIVQALCAFASCRASSKPDEGSVMVNVADAASEKAVQPPNEVVDAGERSKEFRIYAHDSRSFAIVASPKLWFQSASDSAPRLLFDLTTFKPDNMDDPIIIKRAEVIYVPAFSRDNKTIYFIADAWGNERALYAVDVPTGRMWFVSGTSNYYQVIDSCKDDKLVDLLIIRPHFEKTIFKDKVIDWFYLADKTGKRLGVIGPSEDNVQRFLYRRCGIGEEPAAWPTVDIPAALKTSKVVSCKHVTVRYQLLDLLDGTKIGNYRISSSEDGMDHLEGTDIIELLKEQCPTYFASQ